MQLDDVIVTACTCVTIMMHMSLVPHTTQAAVTAANIYMNERIVKHDKQHSHT